MKSALKWIAIIVTVIIFLYAFSSSYYSQNIDHLDYVIALGIDKVPDSDNIIVTFEFANLGSFSENASSEQTEPIINTIIAPTIPNAITIMNAYIGKQLNLSHCKVIAFSKDYAKTGILDEVSFLTHNIQIRPTTNVVVTECSASNYLKRSTSSLEQVLTKYYDIFPTSSEYTGYTSNIPIGRFYENMLDKDSGAVSILGSLVENSSQNNEENSQSSNSQSSQSSESSKATENTKSSESKASTSENNTTSEASNSKNSNENQSQAEKVENKNTITKTVQNNKPDYQSFDSKKAIIEGDRGAENMGLAVFKDDKYVGDLSTIETLCYSLIKDEVDNFIITITSPFNESQKIDIKVGDLSQLDTDIDLSSGKPVINIKFNLNAEIINSIESQNQSYDETLEKLDLALKDYLSNEFKTYLYKTSREYKSDINEFYRLAKRQFLTNSDFLNYDWATKYESADFNVEFNEDIISTLIIRQNE